MPSKKDTLKQLVNTYCRLKCSKIEGVGIFAVRDIPANVNPFYGVKSVKWYEFKMSDLKKIDKAVLKMIDDFFVIEEDQTVMIPSHALNGIDISYYLNHSNKPNIITTDEGFTFKTKRKIKKGEELTSAYETYDHKYKK